MIHNSPRSGFTLIELLIVISLVVVVSVVGFLSLSKYGGTQNLELTTSELVSVIRDVQNRSITQENGTQWGIRFTNSTSAADSYEVFSGSSYSSGAVDQVYVLKRDIELGNPGSGFTTDAVFSAISGKLSENKIISLLTRKGGGVMRDIVMNLLGLVTTRLETDIIGYWHFDEGTGTTVHDATGNDNNGMVYSSSTPAATWVSGKAGNALDFDGNDDYVDVSDDDSLDLTGTFTLATWFKTPSFSSISPLITKNIGGGLSAYRLSIHTVGKIRIEIATSNCGGWGTNDIANTTLQLNAWQHIAVTYDGNTVSHYLNGVLDDSFLYTDSLCVSSSPLYIGWEGGSQYANGSIDEARIYNRALSAQEILDMYNDLK